LGGGIERYVETLQWAFSDQDVPCCRMDLHGSGPAAQARLLAEARAFLRVAAQPPRLVTAHRGLLPVAWMLSRGSGVLGISVICHGSDVWGARGRLREGAEHLIMRRPQVRVVAVSSYTAGALVRHAQATVLPPALSRDWFGALLAADADAPPRGPEMRLVTSFTLKHWRDKGLPQLLAAVAGLGRRDIRLTVCGSGQLPAELTRYVGQYAFCTIRPNCSDRELARELARADLFVLATRTRSGRASVGEGFGMVLAEAQVAGTAVVAPAYGGSRDAYLDGMTGLAPTGESVGELTRLLGELVADPARLAQMGKRASEWSRERYAPERYAPQAVARLL
jgi:glycosyltransferase involved in cell wall biosynthesis